MTIQRTRLTEQLAYAVGANKFDGQEDLSDREYVSVLQWADQYGAKVLLTQVQNNAALRNDYRRYWHDNYKNLPEPGGQAQVIYIDVEEFRDTFESQIELNSPQVFDEWIATYVDIVRKKFVTADGTPLNIEIVTKRPTSGDYSTVVLTDEPDFKTLPKRPRHEQLAFVRGLKYHANRKVRIAYRETREQIQEELGPGATPEEFLDALFQSDFVVNEVYNQAEKGIRHFARAFRDNNGDYGNHSKTDLVIMDGWAVLDAHTHRTFGYDFERGAQLYADITAHEIGHLLGLEHPDRRALESGRTKVSLMAQTSERNQETRLQSSIPFSTYSLSYLHYVLGEKPHNPQRGGCASN